MPSEDVQGSTHRRRARRASRVAFSVPRGAIQLGLGVLALSWFIAYGLGRRHGARSEPAVEVAPPAAQVVRAPPSPAAALIPVTPAITRTGTAPDPRPVVPATPANAAAPAKEPGVPISERAPGDGFGIQVGAYPAREEAEEAIAALAGELGGLDVYLIPVDIPGKGTWYRVRLGHFASRQAAEDRRKALPLAEGALSVPYR